MIGAGLGGLATALRLQGLGAEVTVVEQRPLPGGRAYQLRDAGYTWDTGPSLLTMPWVLEETFAAGGLDLHAELTLRRLDPLYRIRWAGEPEHFDFAGDPARLREEVAKFSAADAAQVEPFLAALAPIYRDGILGRGPPAVPARRRLRAARADAWCGSTRCARCTAFVARFFRHPRVQEAFSFHSLFIGGDPYRVPAIYGALVHLQVADGGWYADGGVYSVVEAMARPLDVRCGEPVEAIEHAGGRVTGVRLAGGERIAADVVVSNADVLRTHELVGRRPPRRRLRETMSCFLLYLGTDRPFPSAAAPHAARRRRLPGVHPRRDARPRAAAARSRPTSTRRRAPRPAMAAPGGDSLAVLLPVPNLRAGIDWERDADRLRDALVADLEGTFGLTGLDAAVRVEHRMTPLDFARDLGAVWGNAFAVEPTLHQSAYFRHPNRDRRLAGLYFAAAGRTRAPACPACCSAPRSRRGSSPPTAGCGRAPGRPSRREHGAGTHVRPAPRRRRCPAGDLADEARATTNRVARTFSLACRLLPRTVREDVYLLYLVFRTLDDLVDDAPPGGGRARRRRGGLGARRGPRPATREVAVLEELATPPPAPARRARRLLRGHALGPRAAASSPRRRSSTPTATASPGTVGVVMAAVLGTTDDAARAARGRRARHGHAAHEHPPRPRRGRRRRAQLPRARGRPTASARRCRARARRCCATRSRRPTRATRRASPASGSCARARGRCAPRRGCTARSCARSSATATAPAPAAPRSAGAARPGWPRAAMLRPSPRGAG